MGVCHSMSHAKHLFSLLKVNCSWSGTGYSLGDISKAIPSAVFQVLNTTLDHAFACEKMLGIQVHFRR